MSYSALFSVLQQMFKEINTANGVPIPQELWGRYTTELRKLALAPELQTEMVRFSDDLYIPKAVEAARVLAHLRQRYNPNTEGRDLVGRIRAEVVERKRPKRDQARTNLTENEQDIAQLAPDINEFSKFQIDGWRKVFNALNKRTNLAIVAPTGAGKTEVFLMPIVYGIAKYLQKNNTSVPRFVLLYPRVELLKDQLSRIFRYVYYAEQAFLRKQLSFAGASSLTKGIVIGFQFGGIGPDTVDTLANKDIFLPDRTFRIVEKCPICINNSERGTLRATTKKQEGVTLITCSNTECGAVFRTSISRNGHAQVKPHILVTTAESLDRLYLNPTEEFEKYLGMIHGIVLDEAHLYHAVYGVHVSHVIRRIESISANGKLAKIAVSATIPNPAHFVAKLFYASQVESVPVHDATTYPNQELAGLEILYFLQSPEEDTRPGAATLIQSVMAVGHGILKNTDRTLVFTESLDMAGRLTAQISDAEGRKQLWVFRTLPGQMAFRTQGCCEGNPANCPLYLEGECWRAILSGVAKSESCDVSISDLKDAPLEVLQVSSQHRVRFTEADVVVTTPSLEVGVDDPYIKATIHYRPPRTVFSFTQRRGRAGRQVGSIAYTVVVLGNTPADHFYFFRRNRLINGKYELPLNPENAAVQQMHTRLQEERERLRLKIRRSNIPDGIWDWLWDLWKNCPLIQDHYGSEINSRLDREQQKRFLKPWVDREKASLEAYLTLTWTLREIENEAPHDLRHAVGLIISTLQMFQVVEPNRYDDLSDHILELINDLGVKLTTISNQEDDLTAKDRIRQLRAKVERVGVAWKRQQLWNFEINQAERLYDFFRILEKLYDNPRNLNSPPNALKIALQAMFYLHLGLPEAKEHGHCRSRMPYFIPDAYFQTVKPVVVEVRESPNEGYQTTNRRHTNNESDNEVQALRQEDVTTLSNTLIPYKPIYRYHGTDLSIIDTEHDLADVMDNNGDITVHLQLIAEGLHEDSALLVQKVYVKPMRGDQTGYQAVQICPRCFALYDVYRRRPCHAPLQAVKLYADPLLERRYEYDPVVAFPITRNLRSLEIMQGITTVYGSSVVAWGLRLSGTEYVRTANQEPFSRFEARYKRPARYALSTKGIAWDLREIVMCLFDRDEVRERLESTLEQAGKTLDTGLILHTAAHMLHKAIASITGVNEVILEYWYDKDAQEVVVWERYEGGAGICEMFVENLRSDSVQLYHELLASVLCPVSLAEQQHTWSTPDSLQQQLTERWKLAANDPFITEVVQETMSEWQAQVQRSGEEIRLTCLQNDGCPVCIYVSDCTNSKEQTLAISRVVGEAIVECLLQRVSAQKSELLMGEAINRDIVAPTILSADPQQGIYDVLLL